MPPNIPTVPVSSPNNRVRYLLLAFTTLVIYVILDPFYLVSFSLVDRVYPVLHRSSMFPKDWLHS